MFKFGDVIENGWAGDGNPTKYGYFIQTKQNTGRLNPGRYVVLTDGKGKVWEVVACDKLRKTGARFPEQLPRNTGDE